jgi:iron(III) transport system permease protein
MVSTATAPIDAITSRDARPLSIWSRIGRSIFPIIIIALMVYLIVQIFIRAFTTNSGAFSFQNFVDVVTQPGFGEVLLNTLIIVAVSSVLALIIGSFLAWMNERTDASLGWFGDVLPIMPLVVPGISMALGWLFLATPRVGLLQPLWQFLHLPALDVNSLPGLILLTTMSLVPFVFLIVYTGFRNLDPSLEEASLVAKAGVLRTLARVSIPSIRGSLAGALLLAIIMATSEFAIPTVIGTPANIETLTVNAVNLVTRSEPAKTGQAAALGLMLLCVLGPIWLVYFRISRRGRFAQVSGRSSRAAVVRLGAWKWVLRVIALVYVFVASVLPFLALLLISFQPFWTPNINVNVLTVNNYSLVFSLSQNTTALLNSLVLAAVGAVVVMVIVGVLASTARIRPSGSVAFALGIIKIPAAIPTVVLGLAFLVAFYGPPFNLGNTVGLLFLAYVVYVFPQSSIVSESAIAQIGPDLFEASAVSGASETRTQMRIFFPLSISGYVAGGALVFAMIAGDVTIASLLAGPGSPVVGQQILLGYGTGTYGELAALAAITSGGIFVVVTGLLLLGRLLRRR